MSAKSDIMFALLAVLSFSAFLDGVTADDAEKLVEPILKDGIHPNAALRYQPKSKTSATVESSPGRSEPTPGPSEATPGPSEATPGPADFPGFGCLRGYCWSYCIGGIPWWGVEWCWTSRPVTGGSVQCSSDSECNGSWRCSSACSI